MYTLFSVVLRELVYKEAEKVPVCTCLHCLWFFKFHQFVNLHLITVKTILYEFDVLDFVAWTTPHFVYREVFQNATE